MKQCGKDVTFPKETNPLYLQNLASRTIKGNQPQKKKKKRKLNTINRLNIEIHIR